MTHRQTRWLVWLLVVMLMILFAACGGEKEKSEQAQTEKEKTSQMEPSAQQAELQPGDAAKGKPLFVQNCSACHGQDATGLKGLGKDLVHSEFFANRTDKELLQYVKEGRAVNDPLNTTGIAMPPKGGNPALTDQQIVHIIAYLRQLQKEAEQ